MEERQEQQVEITFRLTRTYTDADGKTVEDRNFSRSATIRSSQVRDAFEEAKKPSVDPVVLEFDALVFENLEIYAPNGSEYLYTVTETHLDGYQTYAKQGDVALADVATVGTAFPGQDGTTMQVTGLTADETNLVVELVDKETEAVLNSCSISVTVQ